MQLEEVKRYYIDTFSEALATFVERLGDRGVQEWILNEGAKRIDEHWSNRGSEGWTHHGDICGGSNYEVSL